jgi:hypothetical protein
MRVAVDGGDQGAICTQNNAKTLAYAGGTGGPIGVSLNGNDRAGNLYGTYCDASSDERIKDNIQPTAVDALAALQAIPVDQFDIKGPVITWFKAIGAEGNERAKILADNDKPVHQDIGLVAQKVRAVIADAVSVSSQTEMPEGSPMPPSMMTLIDASFTPYLIRAIQQLADTAIAAAARNDDLMERIIALEAKVNQ